MILNLLFHHGDTECTEVAQRKTMRRREDELPGYVVMLKDGIHRKIMGFEN